MCAPQLCQVFSTLFTWSLKDGIVPGVWKTSTVCTFPKKTSDLFDYKPIAITSVVMKCLNNIVRQHLLDLNKGMQDPFQFAYKPNRSIEDVILTLPHTNNPMYKSYFSSAFNTIKPYHLAIKITRLNINPKLVIWIIVYYLENEPFLQAFHKDALCLLFISHYVQMTAQELKTLSL